MERFGKLINIKLEKLEEYKELHSKIWPEVKEAMYKYNLRNFSIFYRDNLLFNYFEYVGNDFENDAKELYSLPELKKWLTLTDSMQEPLKTETTGKWWSDMEEIFHLD